MSESVRGGATRKGAEKGIRRLRVRRKKRVYSIRNRTRAIRSITSRIRGHENALYQREGEKKKSPRQGKTKFVTTPVFFMLILFVYCFV